jgi:hypothetical protein
MEEDVGIVKKSGAAAAHRGRNGPDASYFDAM